MVGTEKQEYRCNSLYQFSDILLHMCRLLAASIGRDILYWCTEKHTFSPRHNCIQDWDKVAGIQRAALTTPSSLGLLSGIFLTAFPSNSRASPFPSLSYHKLVFYIPVISKLGFPHRMKEGCMTRTKPSWANISSYMVFWIPVIENSAPDFLIYYFRAFYTPKPTKQLNHWPNIIIS